MVKDRWNNHLPISLHKARLGCWIDRGSRTSWSGLTCGKPRMPLHITPSFSCIILHYNKVGTDIPKRNRCKVRTKLRQGTASKGVGQFFTTSLDLLLHPLPLSFAEVSFHVSFPLYNVSLWGSIICQVCPRVLITPFIKAILFSYKTAIVGSTFLCSGRKRAFRCN